MSNPTSNEPCMAALIGAYDWARTPLGAIEGWPQSLQTAVDIMLGSGHAMQLAWGPQRTVLYNDAYAPMLGDRHPGALGLPFREAWPEIWNDIEPLVARVFCGETVRFEQMPLIMTRHGYPEDTWWNFSYSPVRNEAGAVAGLLNVTVDATSRMRAERAERERDAGVEALRESEDRLRTVLEGIDEPFYALDHDWQFLFASRSALEIWGKSSEEVLGQNFLQAFPQAANSEAYEAHQRVMLTRRAERVETLSPVINRWVEIDLAPTPQGGLSVAFRDVDARKRAEHQQAFLLELSDALRPLVDAAVIEQTAVDLLGRELGASRVFYATMSADGEHWSIQRDYTDGLPSGAGEYPLSEFQRRRLSDWQSGLISSVADSETDPTFDDLDRAAYAAFQARAAIGIPLVRHGRFAALLVINQIEPREWTEAELTLARETAERTWAAIERARAEAALRAREADLARVQRIGEVGGLDIDVKHGMSSWRSPEYLRLHGLPQDKRSETHDDWRARVHPEDRERAERILNAALAGAGASYENEYRIVRPSDGAVRWIHARADIERDADGSAVRLVGAHLDVTEHKQMQTAIRESEERQVVLLKLSDALRPLNDPEEIRQTTATVLGRHLGACRVAFAEDAGDGQSFIVYDNYVDNAPNMAGRFFYADYGSDILCNLQAGRNRIQPDLQNDQTLSETERQALADVGIGASMNVPLVKAGRLVAFIGVNYPAPHNFQPQEVGLIEEVAERSWAAVERARAEAALRERETRYRTLFETINEGFTVMEAIRNNAGRVVDVIYREANEAWERQSGVKNPLGRKASEMFPAFGQDWVDNWNRVLDTGEAIREENYLADSDRWYNVRYSRVGGAGSNMIAAVFDDITLPKRAGTALRENEQRFRALVTAGTYSVYRMSPDWRLMYQLDSKALVSTSSPIEHWVEKYIPEDDLPRVRAAIEEAIRTKTLFELEHRVRLTDGSIGWILSRAVPLMDANGEIREWFGAGTDVTTRMRAEEALRMSEERFREFGENSADALWIIDAETKRLEYLSPAFERIWGESREAVMQNLSRWAELVHPDDRAAASEALPRLLSGETFVADYRIARPDGEVRWIRDTGFPIKENGVVKRGGGIAQDVTDLKRIEAALRNSEARLRQFGDASQDILWIRDVKTLQWQYLTPAFQTIFGVSRDEALSGNNYHNWLELIIPEDRTKAIEAIRRVGAGERITFDYRIRRPGDGAIRWLRNTDFPLADADGRITLIGGIGQDITEVKHAQDEIERSEERLRSAVEVGRLGLWDWNVVTGEVHWSDEHFRMEGYAVGEVAPSYEAWSARIHPDDRTATEAALHHAMAAHEEYVREFRTVHPDGSVHWLYGRGRFFYDDAGQPMRMIGAMVETTARREWENRQQVLVGELQHRTRNLMGVVRSMADRTVRSSTSLQDFQQKFQDRLEPLARVQGLLSRFGEADRIAFDELLATEFAALDVAAANVTLDGPRGIGLRSKTVQMLAMAFHELGTNAVKHAALGQQQARLVVRWRAEMHGEDERQWLHIDWRESGVHISSAGLKPGQAGRGLELIEDALPYQVGGKTTFELLPAGAHCTIIIPIE